MPVKGQLDRQRAVGGLSLARMGTGLDQQLQMNRQTWAQLNALGVSPGDSITVAAFFFAPDERAAEQLAGALTRAGWTSHVGSLRTGLLRRRTSWAVEASSVVAAVDLARLDALVTELDAAAKQHHAVFDGWGTELPAP